MGALMRLGDVKRFTGLGKRSVYRLADEGVFESVKPVGGQRMYLRRSVGAWVAEMGRMSNPPSQTPAWQAKEC